MPLGIYNSNAFKNASGVQVVASANVEVRRESDGGLAAIFSDRAGASLITQVAYPGTTGFKADANGYFQFFAAGIVDGYQIRVYTDDLSLDKTIRYQATGTVRELDAHTSWASALATAISSTITSFLAAANAAAARAVLAMIGPADTGKVLLGDGTNFLDAALPGVTIINGYIDWTVSGNVLTVAVKTWADADPSSDDPVWLVFRDATASAGKPIFRKLTAATAISINDTATLGTINSTPFRIWCVAFDDGGTVRLAVINCLAGTAPSLSIYPLAGWGIASATLEDNASDNAHVFYSDGAAVTSKAYAVLGYATWEGGLASAGVWSAGPTRKQLFGPDVPLPGRTVQELHSQTGAVATGTTVIPADDTVPQITEGDEYMTQAITPKSAANVLRIEAQAHLSSSLGNSAIVAALFQDATANALAAGRTDKPTATFIAQIRITHHKLAGLTSATTFRVRGGINGAGTTTFNGVSGGRQLGGVLCSYLKVSEVMA